MLSYTIFLNKMFHHTKLKPILFKFKITTKISLNYFVRSWCYNLYKHNNCLHTINKSLKTQFLIIQKCFVRKMLKCFILAFGRREFISTNSFIKVLNYLNYSKNLYVKRFPNTISNCKIRFYINQILTRR